MTEATPIAELTVAETPHLSFFQKTVTLISWSLVVALFLTVGWSVMRPDDPQGARLVAGAGHRPDSAMPPKPGRLRSHRGGRKARMT